MAEERIYVYRFTEDDGICPLEEICTEFPRQCGYCEEIPTRSQLIKRMEIAMHNELIKRNLKDLPCDFRNYAIAGLNAILEDK